MKKRLLALILAGLLTASFASCAAGDNGNDDDSTVDLGGDLDDDAGLDSVEYTDVDLTLFTVSEADLFSSTDESAEVLATIPVETEVHCTKRNAYYCYVTYDGQEGYVARKRLTSVDILAKDFTPVEGGEKIMYVSTPVKLRRYPSAELEASEVITTLAKGTSVTVLSTNEEWSRVEYRDEDGTLQKYFVFSECLTEDKLINPDDSSQWAHLFKTCDPYLTLYTSDAVNLRKAPFTEGDTVIKTIPAESKVIVMAQATIADTGWSYVSVEIRPDTVGDAPYYKEGYMATKYLISGASTSSLDDILETYTGITKLATETTMYATESVNLRSTPDFSSEANNVVRTLKNGEQVTVVATGTHDGRNCYVIKYDINNQGNYRYYFVSARYLTTAEDGTPMLTLDIIRSDYSKFTVLETPRETTIKNTANCYLTPDVVDNYETQLKADAAVTVVAEETGSAVNTWLVVKTSDGALYFVAKANVN